MRQPAENKARPPALGNVAIERTSDTEWRVKRDGETVASGLTFAQATAFIRGELDIDALQGEGHEQR